MKKWIGSILVLVMWQVSTAYANNALLFGVNEGTSGSIGFLDRQDKYKGLADYLSAILKRPVLLESAQSLKSLNNNLNQARYGLLLVRPSHISAKAMRDQKYQLVASAKGDAITYFIVHKDSPLKKPQDIKGKSIAMPDTDAYPSHIAKAMLRDLGLDLSKENIRHFRSQEAVGYAVEQKLIDVGVVVSYSKVAKEWEEKGGRFLWQSEKQPFWSVIAAPTMSAEDIAKVREALMKLDSTENGRAILERIGIKSFVTSDQNAYLAMLKWVDQ